MESKSEIPTISIVLPTYNRIRFLESALKAIVDQSFKDWELIIVDDGSSDGSGEFMKERLSGLSQPWQYIYQENQGAYSARNRGLDSATGTYVAFYDSDDRWLPHHLKNCVEALKRYADVDWVYGSSRIVDYESGRVVSDNCFYEEGKPKDFMLLAQQKRGDLCVIAIEELLEKVLGGVGLYAGLQNSVIRRSFFETRRFVTEFYNEAEDQAVIPRAIDAGMRFAYFDDVHVEYRLHQSNASGAATAMSFPKKEKLIKGLIEGFEKLPQQIELNDRCAKSLRKRLAALYMWQLGYSVYWRYGHARLARNAYKHAISLDPWKMAYWKTLAVSYVKRAIVYD